VLNLCENWDFNEKALVPTGSIVERSSLNLSKGIPEFFFLGDFIVSSRF
jgi:hypothetical protein